MKLTEKDVQRWLMRERYAKGFVLPNFTPSEWFECDVFEVTPAGYFREYEIKLTRADFLADRRKFRHSIRWDRNSEKRPKHELLQAAHKAGPVQFWYVTPPGLIDVAAGELPPWAGLLEFMVAWSSGDKVRLAPVSEREAPRLHDAKINPHVMQSARGACYWRFHRATTLED